MNPSQLEITLERGCLELGGRLHEPMTGEAIRAYAAQDDQNGISIAEHRKLMEGIRQTDIPEPLKLMAAALETCALTEAQRLVYNDLVPEYRRQSTSMDGYFIQYDVMQESHEEFVSVHLLLRGSSNTEIFWIDRRTDGTAHVNMPTEKKLRTRFGSKWYTANAKRIAKLQELHGQPYDGEAVGKAVLQFIKGEAQ